MNSTILQSLLDQTFLRMSTSANTAYLNEASGSREHLLDCIQRPASPHTVDGNMAKDPRAAQDQG